MTVDVTVVDYDRGNLFSVSRALQHCGAEVEVTDSPDRLATAKRVVLPGVGAFGDAMDELNRRGWTDPLKAYAQSGKPLFGVCIGMQVMFDESEEFGMHEGLGLIPGVVTAIPDTGCDGEPHKVPHIGWTEILPTSEAVSWRGTILDELPSPAYCYFVHSYAALPADEGDCLSECVYDGRRITAVVRRGSLWGCQFHPEKSGDVGLRIMKNFLALA